MIILWQLSLDYIGWSCLFFYLATQDDLDSDRMRDTGVPGCHIVGDHIFRTGPTMPPFLPLVVKCDVTTLIVSRYDLDMPLVVRYDVDDNSLITSNVCIIIKFSIIQYGYIITVDCYNYQVLLNLLFKKHTQKWKWLIEM